jgi:hypothetical protein
MAPRSWMTTMLLIPIFGHHSYVPGIWTCYAHILLHPVPRIMTVCKQYEHYLCPIPFWDWDGNGIHTVQPIVVSMSPLCWRRNTLGTREKWKKILPPAPQMRTHTPIISWGYLFIQTDFTRLVTLFQGTWWPSFKELVKHRPFLTLSVYHQFTDIHSVLKRLLCRCVEKMLWPMKLLDLVVLSCF